MQCITQCSSGSSWVFEGLYSDCSDIFERSFSAISDFVRWEDSQDSCFVKMARKVAFVVFFPLDCLVRYFSNRQASDSKSIIFRGFTSEEVGIGESIFPKGCATTYNLSILKNKFRVALNLVSGPWKQEGKFSQNNLPKRNKEPLSSEEAKVMQKIQKNILEDIQRKTSQFSLFRIPGKEKIRRFCEEKLESLSSMENTKKIYTESDFRDLTREISRDQEWDFLSRISSLLCCSN